MKRYAVCGLSNRGIGCFVLPLLGRDVDAKVAQESYDDVAVLTAVVDSDRERTEAFRQWLRDHDLPEVATFTDLDDLLAHDLADAVIIASPDHLHAEHARAVLAADRDVIVEKPMVTTGTDAQALMAAETASRGQVTVTHNSRYSPRHGQLKELIRAGTIGRVVQVQLEHHVDTAHGASYFVRWNRERERSGGLTLHKSTHHIDLLNWLIDDDPVRVAASGGTFFYGPDSPHRPRNAEGLPLTGAALRAVDPYWHQILDKGQIRVAGQDQERRSLLDLPYRLEYPAGRELSVYDEAIDSLDTVTAVLSYRRGAAAAYTVNFSSPWEGARLVINGTHGQLEVLSGKDWQGRVLPRAGVIAVRPLFSSAHEIPVRVAQGDHAGADPRMRHDIFRGPSEESISLGMTATTRDGALAVCAGEALRRSVETGRTVTISLQR